MNPVVRKTIERCRGLGLRRTRALEELLITLEENSRPMTLAELAGSERLADQCDQATVEANSQATCEVAPSLCYKSR